jgi:hypothetical protein
MNLLKRVGVLGLVSGMVAGGEVAPAAGEGLTIRPVSNAAVTAPVRNTYGTVRSIVGPVLTVNVGDGNMRFVLDDNTGVFARGASHASRRAGGSLPIASLVRSGDIARISYRERDGSRHVLEIQIKGRATIATR